MRQLGVYSDVRPSNTPASALRTRKGLIISGGPASVCEAGSPDIDPAILALGVPVLGICYGHQLLAKHLGGAVQKGERGEYGLARLKLTADDPLFAGVCDSRIWMSHFDTVASPPSGFQTIASSDVSAIAAMSDPARKLFGLQFHPEVIHTEAGMQILENFLFGICRAGKDWDPSGSVLGIEHEIREIVRDRNVFFFVSGGVDSTVAYTLCLRALGPDRVYGIFVDTGLMRKDETAFVRGIFRALGATHFLVDDAEAEFLAALDSLYDPEAKRRVIGEQFLKVQERILTTDHFLNGHWILGQGTIYPDTIESGGSAHADLIKTHHNRVPGVQALIDSGRIVEPLTSFYKDEVREIGRELGISPRLLSRHPFPGPGLAIRCLCSDRSQPLSRDADGYLLPIRSVGVQGDARSYRHVLALAGRPTLQDVQSTAPVLTNSRSDINRVVALCAGKASLDSMRVYKTAINKQRLDVLREADALVRDYCAAADFDSQVWQFPVVLLPVGVESSPESVVLRPINSVDGMTADVVLMPDSWLDDLVSRLLNLPSLAAVFYDLTHKPPGTIEWE